MKYQNVNPSNLGVNDKEQEKIHSVVIAFEHHTVKNGVVGHIKFTH